MGICWGSPNFPSPSFGRDNRNGNLTLSSDSSAVPTPHDSKSSDGAVATDGKPGSLSRNKSIRVFTYLELKAATNNFSYPFGETRFDGNNIIHGGWLSDGSAVKRQIAIKLLQFSVKPSKKLLAMVLAKVESFGRLSHVNVFELLGYCSKGRKLLLVYEFPPVGWSLEDILYNSSVEVEDWRKIVFPPFRWHTRLQIALAAAQGLAYLHLMDTFLQCFQASYVFPMVHGSGMYAVKIAPFSFLATDSSDNARRTMSKNAVGAKNLIDIEIGDAVATVRRRKQNVYDFGVLLLEILTGLALGRNRWSPEYGSRIEWIKKRVLNGDNMVAVMDSNMGSYPHDDAFQVAQLAVRCLESCSEVSMENVVEALREVKANEISFPIPAES